MARFKRILLKLSGESLMGKQGYGIDPERLSDYARQIKEVSAAATSAGAGRSDASQPMRAATRNMPRNWSRTVRELETVDMEG